MVIDFPSDSFGSFPTVTTFVASDGCVAKIIQLKILPI